MNKRDRIELYKGKLNEIEIDYCEKLKQAKIEDNQDKIITLFFELNILRQFYKKKLK